MDRPSASQPRPARSKSHPQHEAKTPIRTVYLVSYNALSAILWGIILLRTGRIALLSPAGLGGVYATLGWFTRMVQTAAGLEVVHAAVGIVRAPLLTTLMQVASRFLLVWIVTPVAPLSTAQSLAYTSMLLAWSLTEVIRYTYFTLNLASSVGAASVPLRLTKLRYSAFYALYPLGIGSECWLVWKSRGEGQKRFGEGWGWFVWVVLAIYVPGAWVLFTHMMKQRRKVVRGLREAQGGKKGQ